MDMFYLMQRLQDFKKAFKGDPKQMIDQMLKAGKISEEDYKAAEERTRQFMNMFRNPAGMENTFMKGFKQ